MLNVIWFVPPALEVVAERRNFLADAGVTIQAAQTASSDEQFEALRDGRQDVAVTAMDNVILWQRRPGGEDLRIVGQIEATTAISLFARPDFGAIPQLQRGRLLVDSAENGFVIALMALLADGGVRLTDCSFVPAGGVKERFAALLDGQGDATLLGPPFDGMAEQAGMRRLADVDVAYPGFPGQGIVLRAGLAPERRAEVVRWLRALERARAECRRDAASAAWDLAAAGVPPPVAEKLVGAAADKLAVDRAGVELLIGQRARLGLPGADATFEDLTDPGPLADAFGGI